MGSHPSRRFGWCCCPQAITLMLPSIVSQLVVVLKDSALGFLILYPELVRSGQTLASLKGNLIPTFIVLAAIFIIINYLLTRLARYLERRLQARRARAEASRSCNRSMSSVAGTGRCASGAWRQALTSGLGCSGLPDDGHLDLAGVGQLLLDLLGDIPGQNLRLDVVDDIGCHHDPNFLPACIANTLSTPSRAPAISSSRSSR